MSGSEVGEGTDWFAIGKKYLVPIILIAIIGVESSILAFTVMNQSQTQSSTNSLVQEWETKYANLTAQYNNLTAEYEDLQDDYEDLQREYEAGKCLHIGNSLASYYDYLRQEIGPTGASDWWTTPDEYWQLAVEFAANLALHDLAEIYWPSIEGYYYDVVGEYSYNTARAKIDEVMDLIGTSGSDSGTEKIQKILGFIEKYITYEYDVNDIFSAPVETLGFRSGDCDDFTILSATLLKAAGLDTAVGFFVNDDDEYHSMVLVHLETLVGYDYWYFPDLTDLGLAEGSWIIIESQITLDEQDSDWISDWYLIAGAAIDV